MARKIRIGLNCYQVKEDPIQEKLDLVTGIFNLVSTINKSLNQAANIVLVHGAGSAADLWAGNAAMDLGIPLEIFLPFPRITHIVRSKLNPLQAEALNTQINYCDYVKVINKTYHFHGLLKRTMALVDVSDIAAIWGDNKKTKNFWDYCRKKGKPVQNLLFYSLSNFNNVHLQGEL